MTPTELKKMDRALTNFVEELVDGLGRPERLRAMGLYVQGLLLDGERKSTQPMAARLCRSVDDEIGMRQRLHETVSNSSWDEKEIFRRVAKKLVVGLPEISAFVIDDTGFPKKGDKSVGVQRQYSGTLGRVDNCQVAVSLHLAGAHGSGCIGMRLFLPEQWAQDKNRRAKAGVPEHIAFQKKWEISLAQIDEALEWGVSRLPVLADAGYGDSTDFRSELEARKLQYVVGVSSVPTIWRPGIVPVVARKSSVGRSPTRLSANEEPVSLAEFAREIQSTDFRTVSWRNGSKGTMKARFCAFRVYSAERHTKMHRPKIAPVWLIVEATGEEKRPYKFFFSNLSENHSLKELVALVKLRWRVERDYQELKGELGLDHFEGRGWRGFHHHAALCIAAHAFLALQRALFPPEDSLDAVGS